MDGSVVKDIRRIKEEERYRRSILIYGDKDMKSKLLDLEAHRKDNGKALKTDQASEDKKKDKQDEKSK